MIVSRTYRTRDGRQDIPFRFVQRDGQIEIVCTAPPPLRGRDPSVHKTHLYSTGVICFVRGREPKSQAEAERRAAEWAEYVLEYIRTGVAQ